MFHIHTDTDTVSLIYFSDKNGICAYNDRIKSYAMQDADIIGVFYDVRQLREFYEYNKHKDNLPVIYFFDENRWNNRRKS